MELPNIKINYIRFQLEGYNPPDHTGKHSLKIRSFLANGTSYELYLYQSESSLGFWRLGCWDRGIYYKGKLDYVQQTFIHFTLQEFINKNISKIKGIPFKNEHPELSDKIKSEYKEFLDYSFPFCYSKLASYESTRKHYIPIHINDPSRIVEIKPFSDFEKDETKRCGFWKVSPEPYLKELSEEFSRIYQLDQKSIQFLYNDTYEYSTMLNESTIKFNIISNYFICRLISRNKQPDLYLYYTIYNIVNRTNIDAEILLVDKHYFPLFLTPNIKITPFGTYQHYVLSAGYICKLFEHIKQAEKFGRIISRDTKYIGYMYNDLFPFNEIKTL
jgi:hypothetical protein